MNKILLKRIAVIFGLTCLAIQSLSAAPYYRFWQGYKQDTLTSEDFRKGLAENFMPKVVNLAKGNGLIAYLPALLLPNTCIDQTTCLPDEIAIVSFSSKEKYEAVSHNPAYGVIHKTYFNKASHSLEPIPFIGKLENGQAYDVLQSSAGWGSGFAVYCVSKKLQQLTAYIQTMKKQQSVGLVSYLVLGLVCT